jgi:TRAP-type C4-dicarboxylate transport system permease small subunit
MNLCKIVAILFLLSLSGTYVAAQAPRSLPENTIDCTAFKKQPNGWFVGAPTTLSFGAMTMRLFNQLIEPHSGIETDGVDLYDAIEHKCGGNRS